MSDEEIDELTAEDKESEKEAKKEAKQKEIDETLDPVQDFIKLLKDAGVKKSAVILADVFFKGDVGDPQHLNKTLLIGGVAAPQRRLILTSYYGTTPEELGVDLKSAGFAPKEDIKEKELDIARMTADNLKQRLLNAQAEAQIRQLEKMNTQEEEKPKSKKVVERPLIRNGEVVMQNGIPVLERVIIEGDGYTSSSSNESPLAIVMAMMKMFEKKETNPNEKPSWAIEMENVFKVNKAEEEKKRIEDELRREKEKREERERELTKELERQREDAKKELERIREDSSKEIQKQKELHDKELQRQKDDIDFRLKSLQDSFNSEMQHRDQLDEIKTAYGAQFEEMKKDLDMTRKDIKSTVATEMTKTGSKILDRATQTADGVIQPFAEVMKDMYATQIEVMRKQANLASKVVPETSEDELKRLV